MKIHEKLLFVYGTMMRDGRNHDRLQNATFMTKCEITGYDMFLRWTDGMYYAPVLVENEDNVERIFGEIYELQEMDLRFIDIFEGHPHIYERILIDCPYLYYPVMNIYLYRKVLTSEQALHKINAVNGLVKFNI
jgi:gamma-glutamylcyclotransferase (GGCT)/AIG2-like uncharacterized protein YtfP